jgi:hypothetical protein
VLATACPYCVRMLADAAARGGFAGRVAVMDIAHLLAESVPAAAETHGPEPAHAPFDREACHA